LGGISSALNKAGSEQTLRDSARLPTYLYQLSNDGKDKTLSVNSDLGCVLVVRGKFNGPDPADQSKVSFPKEGVFLGVEQENDRIARLVASNVPVTEIATLFEAAIKTSNDNVAIHYEGRFLEINAFQGSRSSDTRALVVGISINAPGAKENDSTLSLALLNLGEVRRGVIKGPLQLRGQRSSWLGGLGMNDAALKAIEKVQVTDGKIVGVMPVTIEGTLIETEKGNQALLFIADVLGSTKAATSKALSEEILKDEKKERAAQADAIEKLIEDEETAYAAHLAAIAALAKMVDPIAEEKTVKEFEVARTKRAWCLKFKALEKIGSAPRGRPACV
jgi:hypothetical protein